jgi:hypothetical protein
VNGVSASRQGDCAISTHLLGGERNAKRWRRFEAEVRVIALWLIWKVNA